MEVQSERALDRVVAEAAAGDQEAIAQLIARFQDRAWALAYARLRDPHLAEDAAQEALVDAMLHLGQLRAPAAFPRWFSRVVFKHCDRLRRGRRVRTVALEDAAAAVSDGEDPFSNASTVQTRGRLQEAVDRLPAGERTAILMTYLGEQTAAEAATALGLPPRPSACARGVPGGAAVDIALIIQAVNNGLHGCGTMAE